MLRRPEAFQIVVAPPPGFGDAVPANNAVSLPYNVTVPFADLRLGKTKSPSAGPQPAGTVISNTLTLTNSGAGAKSAAYTPTQPLRIVDYARPEEVAGNAVNNVTTGWSCDVTAGISAANRRFIPAGPPGLPAKRQAPATWRQTLMSSYVSPTTLASVGAPVASLVNQACTGGQALNALGLTAEPTVRNRQTSYP